MARKFVTFRCSNIFGTDELLLQMQNSPSEPRSAYPRIDKSFCKSYRAGYLGIKKRQISLHRHATTDYRLIDIPRTKNVSEKVNSCLLLSV